MAREQKQMITRRGLLQGTAAAGLVVAGGTGSLAASACKGAAAKKYANADFYDAQGKFLVDKAREAYFDMMERFHYPIPDSLRKGMWILEFGLGDFVHVGMAGIFWLNRKEYGYFGHEIYLLPGQMIAEHAHVKTDGGPAKMESWHVRHGMIYTFGEGEETRPLPVALPESQLKIGAITCKHCEPLGPGELRDLNRLDAKHFMYAGPEGAIVTEYATYHDNAGLRFSNPNVKL